MRTKVGANPTHKDSHAETLNARAKRYIEQCSGENRDGLLRVLQRRRNKGVADSSNVTWAQCMRRADTWARGRHLADLSADDWVDFVADMRDRYAASTVYTIAGFVKASLADLMGVDEAPKAIRRALSVREPSRRPQGRLIRDEEFTALLTTAASVELHGYNDLQRLEIVSLLHVLRDSGFRARELLALRNGSVQLSGEHAAYLKLPEDAPRLKTGPREIAVAKCVPALKAWMAAHPAAGAPRAPLFPRVRCHDGLARMHYNYLRQLVHDLADISGVNAATDRDKPLSCHDFRHTRATEAARANWHPTKMEAYFGWSPGSKMAARYSHLARSDLRDQVLQDAGLLATGEPREPVRDDPGQALGALLKQLISSA